MKIKRLFVTVLSTILLVTFIAACNGNDDSRNSDKAETETIHESMHNEDTPEPVQEQDDVTDLESGDESVIPLLQPFSPQNSISSGTEQFIGLRNDGTVLTYSGSSLVRGQTDLRDLSDWVDITAVSMSFSHAVGLRSNGTVFADGYYGFNQSDIDGWTDIIEISAGYAYLVGLRSDGTVVAVGGDLEGDDVFGKLNIDNWTDIVAISAGHNHTVGLRDDGTVVAVGEERNYNGVEGWTDIIAISAGQGHTVGLKSDGTVVSVGGREDQLDVVSAWTDIIAISAGIGNTLGLTTDGSVVGVAENRQGVVFMEIDWTDIVAIYAGQTHIMGLRANGTVVASNGLRDEDLGEWTDIRTTSP